MDDDRFDAIARALAAPRSRRRALRALLAGGGGLLAARGRGPTAAAPGDGAAALRGGALATFEVCGEHHCDRFRLWATTPATVAQLRALARGESTAHIPIGPLAEGPGPAAHNRPWGWHFDPARVRMAELAIEACDGEPAYVEVHLADFLHLGAYCPWGARLVALDLRPGAPLPPPFP